MTIKAKNIYSAIVIAILLCISGNPLLAPLSQWIYVISAVPLTILAIYRHKLMLDKTLIFWVGASCLLFLSQIIFVGNVSVQADINFIIRLYIAFICSKMLGDDFAEVYFNAMLVLSATSLVLFLLTILNGSPFGIGFDRYKTLGIFHSLTNEFTRNSGFFWEPGAFQGHIILAMLLMSNHLIPNIKRRPISWLILFVTLISTQSTTGYVAFAVFVSLFILSHSKNYLTLACVAVVFCIALVPVIRLEFIGEKIINELDVTSSLTSDSVSWSRTGSMIVDFSNILRHPLCGNGFLMEARYPGIGELMGGAGNGFTGAVNMLGIPFMLMFLTGIFRNLRSFRLSERCIVVFVLIMVLSGEYFLNYPLFWSLLFISLPADEKILTCQEHE